MLHDPLDAGIYNRAGLSCFYPDSRWDLSNSALGLGVNVVRLWGNHRQLPR